MHLFTHFSILSSFYIYLQGIAMRPISGRPKLPQICHKNIEDISLMVNSQSTNNSVLHSSSILILHSSHLPLNFALHFDSPEEVHLSISNQTLTAQIRGKTINLPWKGYRSGWLLLELGQTIRNISLSSPQNENHPSEIPIYNSEKQWSLHNPKRNLARVNLQRQIQQILLVAKKERTRNNSTNKIRNRISQKTIAFLESKFPSEIQSKNVTMIWERGHKTHKTDNINLRGDKPFRVMGKTVKMQSSLYRKSAMLRNSTSNSVRSEIPCLIRHSNFLEDISQSHNNQDVKFYEQIPYTIEELQLKRKKFESTVEREMQGSEVVEDIHRPQNSQIVGDQTLQRGIQEQNGNRVQEESGTLCQSVFE